MIIKKDNRRIELMPQDGGVRIKETDLEQGLIYNYFINEDVILNFINLYRELDIMSERSVYIASDFVQKITKETYADDFTEKIDIILKED